MSDLIKGQRVYLIRMDNKGLYAVEPGTMKGTGSETVLVRIGILVEGVKDHVVVDARREDVYQVESDALKAAAEKCQASGFRWLTRSAELMAQWTIKHRQEERKARSQ